MAIPSDIKLRRKSNLLELQFGDELFQLPAEYLRVHSPSAEVRGHGPGQAQLQHGKIHVQLTGLEPQGNYALRLLFDDGHTSGIYTWDYLYDLGHQRELHWQNYLDALTKEGKSRDPEVSVVKFFNS
ncbi:MAG: DUF971 domain-containing protein [Cellvibrionaceae bacterium]|nr:DUF971 domain-containing protein [Cellvibrionaceae bacterium]